MRSSKWDQRRSLRSSRQLEANIGLNERQLAKLCAASVQTNGRIAEILRILKISPATLRQRVSRLRGIGVARTVMVVNPLKMGRHHQFTTWVKMSSMSPRDIARFEDDILHDPAVMVAQRITGDADYRLNSCHTTLQEAGAWTQRLRCKPMIAQVRQAGVRHLFGHELQGVVLTGDLREGDQDAPDLASCWEVVQPQAQTAPLLETAA